MTLRRMHKTITPLRSLKLFSGCTAAELKRISGLTMLVRARQGVTLAKEGEPGREFFVIAMGTATVSRCGVPLARLDAGSFFGETALLDGGCRTATVVADTDLSLFAFSPAEFRALQNVAPTVAHRMLAEMGKRLRVTDELLEAESSAASWRTRFAEKALDSLTQELVFP